DKSLGKAVVAVAQADMGRLLRHIKRFARGIVRKQFHGLAVERVESRHSAGGIERSRKVVKILEKGESIAETAEVDALSKAQVGRRGKWCSGTGRRQSRFKRIMSHPKICGAGIADSVTQLSLVRNADISGQARLCGPKRPGNDAAHRRFGIAVF